VNDYFADAWHSPYMILTDRIRPEWAEKLKGVVHVDGSCRVQTVDESWNERFHQLIKRYGTITGTYVLLNTSFNVRGMPIVETPAEAVDVFLNSAMDELYLNNIRVVKKAE
jgi:carbamoyltransferase